MNKLLIAVLCVVAVACGGTSTDVDDTRSMHPDDRMEMTERGPTTRDSEPEMAMEPEPVVEVPTIRPIGEDPSEEDEPESKVVDRNEGEPVVTDEDPEAPTPDATDSPAAMPEPVPAEEEPVEVADPAPEPTIEGSEPEPAQEPEAQDHQLVIQFNGPPEQEIHAGAADQPLFQFSLTATGEPLSVQVLPIGIQCDEGLIYGSAGTSYFTDIKLVDVETGAVLGGPHEIAPSAEGMEIVGYWFSLGDVFEIPEGGTRNLAITADIAAFEDASGEFFGNTCRVTFDFVERFVWNTSVTEVLPNEAINITEDIPGNPFTVSAAAWGEFSFCDAGSSFEGCCTTGGFARDMAEFHGGMFVKSASSPSVYYVGSDMQRYVFPTRTEFYSWLDWDENNPTEVPTLCANIREFSDEMIASLPTGGSVPVRPGTYLLKISTDMYLHAVGRQRTLHKFWAWYPEGCSGGVPSLGDPLCGVVGSGPDSGDEAHDVFPNAEARVRTIPDALYLTYTVNGAIGEMPVPVGEYDPAVEYDWGSPNTLEAELGLFDP